MPYPHPLDDFGMNSKLKTGKKPVYADVPLMIWVAYSDDHSKTIGIQEKTMILGFASINHIDHNKPIFERAVPLQTLSMYLIGPKLDIR